MKIKTTIMTLLTATTFMGARANYRTVDTAEFARLAQQVDSVQVLDVRTPEEYAEGHLNNAVLMDVMDSLFSSKVMQALPRSRKVAVYCRSGKRSAHAAELLTQAGYEVINLDGGIMAWERDGKPVVTKDSPVPDSTGYTVYEGQPCPDFTVQLTDGRTVRMSDLRGKVVMLQFTASWCGVCRKEMPHIEQRIWQRHKDNSDFVLLGIDLDEPLDKVKAFAASTGITYPLALDPKGGVFSLFTAPDSGVTRNVLISRDGTIIHRTRLYNEQEFDALVKHIDQELR